MIGTGRAAGRQAALEFGAHEYIDLDNEEMPGTDVADMVFDVIGGEIANHSFRLIRPGGTMVTIAGPTETSRANVRTIDFVVEANAKQLAELVQRLREGRLRVNTRNITSLDDAVAAFNSTGKAKGKMIIQPRR